MRTLIQRKNVSPWWNVEKNVDFLDAQVVSQSISNPIIFYGKRKFICKINKNKLLFCINRYFLLQNQYNYKFFVHIVCLQFKQYM